MAAIEYMQFRARNGCELSAMGDRNSGVLSAVNDKHRLVEVAEHSRRFEAIANQKGGYRESPRHVRHTRERRFEDQRREIALARELRDGATA
jgi:hypothetical protein